ncbi:MAG: hypothetical protein HC854_03595 [Flavobacterium sp.]|nr:hypothetical protein [Flavobacterium sp.]
MYCQEKYLAQEWKYENDKLIELITYTYKKGKHTKKNYYYDGNLNLIKQIDSTGWYFSNGKLFLDSTTEITYNDNGKNVIIMYNRDKPFSNHYYKKNIAYNNNNQIIKREENSDNQIDIHEFVYENSNLKFQKIKYGNNDDIKFEYSYNEKGLIKEQKHFIKNLLVEIERYYYN